MESSCLVTVCPYKKTINHIVIVCTEFKTYFVVRSVPKFIFSRGNWTVLQYSATNFMANRFQFLFVVATNFFLRKFAHNPTFYRTGWTVLQHFATNFLSYRFRFLFVVATNCYILSKVAHNPTFSRSCGTVLEYSAINFMPNRFQFLFVVSTNCYKKHVNTSVFWG
jgi:hypothetical protein